VQPIVLLVFLLVSRGASVDGEFRDSRTMEVSRWLARTTRAPTRTRRLPELLWWG